MRVNQWLRWINAVVVGWAGGWRWVAGVFPGHTGRLVRGVVLLLGVCWLLLPASDVAALHEHHGVRRWLQQCDCPASKAYSAMTGYVHAHLSGSRSAQDAGVTALFVEPYVPPALAERMDELHPVIMAAAERHNREALSQMSDAEFAEVLALLIYNEHNGWLEDEFEALRTFTPLYQHLQQQVNQRGMGSNFSVWPANLRPSVALEILQQQVPVPAPGGVITVPLTVEGSAIVPAEYDSSPALFAAITAEICEDELAVEYLAANLERGLYRAQYEDVTVTWQVLAAWHNQGIVHPDEVRANPYARTYIRRAAAYLPLAHRFVHSEPHKHVSETEAAPARDMPD